MSAFIRGIANISPQDTFGADAFPVAPNAVNGITFSAVEPDYKLWVNPIMLRRMTRILKMGIAASGMALKDAGITAPDAIVTATALGCTQDTDRFLQSMIEREETALAPTSFIQSTHNTIGGQIALMNKWQVYNMCYTQRGASFESALLDAILLMKEGSATNPLVGAIDELIPNSIALMRRMGLYRSDGAESTEIFKRQARGSIGGEGAQFFVLSDKPDNALASLDGIKTSFKPGLRSWPGMCEAFLNENGVQTDEIDLLIMGRSGDSSGDAFYDVLKKDLFAQTPEAVFKNLSGEYQTATGFALWMATMALKLQTVPDYAMFSGKVPGQIRRVLICNHFLGRNHSFILLSKC
jgi:hypothetical protein